MIQFLKIKTSEVDQLQSLASKIWKEHYAVMLGSEQIDYMLNKMYNTEILEKELLDSHFFWNFVTYNNTIIGYCCCKKDDLRLFLSKLYVDVSYHGKGIGQKILDKVRDIAVREKLNAVYLNVNKENEKAIKAYQKFGFKKIESKVTDIGNGFVMNDFVYQYSIE